MTLNLAPAEHRGQPPRSPRRLRSGYPVIAGSERMADGNPSSLRAVAFDLKTFFLVVRKDPVEVTAADMFDFLADQRGDRTVVRPADRKSGLSARTIARRLSSVSGLYAYLVARDDTPLRANPVPRGLMTRPQGGTMRSRIAPWCGCRGPCRGSCLRRRLTGWSARCARAGTGRWCWACCWPGCAGARCWGFGSRMYRSPTGGWPWWRAREATTGWSRPRTGSSRLSAPTCTASGPPGRRQTGTIGHHVLDSLLPARRLRVSPRAVKRPLSRYACKSLRVHRRTYKATLSIDILTIPLRP
jgi:hypothetical protein